jgi:signal transduction histidine kinase
MITLAQDLWDRMRVDLQRDALPQMQTACQALLSERLGPLAAEQIEDLQAVERAVAKLARRMEGEHINWANDTEAAHALRGPLNATLGFSRLMIKGASGPLNPAQQDALQTLHRVSRRLLGLFNLLLDALLLAADEIWFDVESISMEALLNELVAFGRTRSQGGAFSFHAESSPGIERATIRGDSKRVKQSLAALMTAAGQSCGDGTLMLRARQSTQSVIVELESRGCSLPAQLSDRLSQLLTDDADRSLPYDLHLRLGTACTMLERMGSHVAFRHTGVAGTFVVSLPQA